MIESPLKQFPVLLLSLLIYTSAYFTQALRGNRYEYSHWKYLTRGISTGIFILHKFERFHNISLFCGLRDVFLNAQEAMDPKSRIRGHLRIASFSTDLKVGKTIQGNSGMLMVLKIDDSINYNICMSDISWICEYPLEKEVLILNLPLDISPSQCLTQWNGKDTQQFISLTKDLTPESLYYLASEDWILNNNNYNNSNETSSTAPSITTATTTSSIDHWHSGHSAHSYDEKQSADRDCSETYCDYEKDGNIDINKELSGCQEQGLDDDVDKKDNIDNENDEYFKFGVETRLDAERENDCHN